MTSLGKWTCDNCSLLNTVGRSKCQACFKISPIIKTDDTSSESTSHEPVIDQDNDIMQVSWKTNCCITYSITSLNTIITSYYEDILSQGFAINQHNGWIAILTNKHLILLAPTTNNIFDIKLIKDININMTETKQCRVRFINDNIYIFKHFSDGMRIQNIIYHYKLININNKYVLQRMNSIKNLSFKFISSNVIDVDFTQNLLLTLSEYHDELGIYRLHSTNSCKQNEIEYDRDNGVSWYFDVRFTSKEKASNNFHIVSYDGYNDIDDNPHNKTYQNCIYINYGKKLWKFHLSQPNYTLTNIINTEYFGDNNNFCSSKHYGVFWINLEKNALFQSFADKHHRIYRIGSKTPRNMFALNTDNISDITELSRIVFDETYGISGRLLIVGMNKNGQYVMLEMHNNDEAILLYDVCNNGILNPIYDFLYGDIEAIMNTKSIEPPQRKKIGTLHCKVTPQFQNVKQLLVDGFIGDCTSKKNVPMDIVRMCTLYYDEAKHWKIDCDDLRKHYKLSFNNILQNAFNQIYTEVFALDDIEMKCSFHANASEKDSIFYLRTLMPKDVDRLFVYSEVYCYEVDAHFRHLVNFYRWWSDATEESNDEWQSYNYTMYLNCNDFKEINFSYYFQVLSIKYMEDTGKLPYFKPIFMKRKLQYTWNIDEELLGKFRTAALNQMFISDTFDEFNNNWGLWMVPNDAWDNPDGKQARLTLNIIKRPSGIEYFKVRCLIASSYNDNIVEKIVTFWESDTHKHLTELCPSKAFFDMDLLWITVNMEIVSVENETEYMIKYADIFE